nr:DUF4331 family protein [Hymenobacter baengnokdamensis]
MKKNLTRPVLQVALAAAAVGGLLTWSGHTNRLEASSHREAPLIADDPLADNTDLYAFRSPDAPNNDANATVTIVANYIPFELPQGGPNFNTFGRIFATRFTSRTTPLPLATISRTASRLLALMVTQPPSSGYVWGQRT